jgi:hypothetical protein
LATLKRRVAWPMIQAHCAAPDTAHLRPDKIAVWPVEGERYGIDLSYAGVTGYTRADQAHQTITANGMNATFRQELGDM